MFLFLPLFLHCLLKCCLGKVFHNVLLVISHFVIWWSYFRLWCNLKDLIFGGIWCQFSFFEVTLFIGLNVTTCILGLDNARHHMSFEMCCYVGVKQSILHIFCSHTRPTLKVVDDIVFKKPVEIGSLLFLSSQVLCSLSSSWKQFLLRITSDSLYVYPSSPPFCLHGITIRSLGSCLSKPCLWTCR